MKEPNSFLIRLYLFTFAHIVDLYLLVYVTRISDDHHSVMQSYNIVHFDFISPTKPPAFLPSAAALAAASNTELTLSLSLAEHSW
jgi:hypothetical protein